MNKRNKINIKSRDKIKKIYFSTMLFGLLSCNSPTTTQNTTPQQELGKNKNITLIHQQPNSEKQKKKLVNPLRLQEKQQTKQELEKNGIPNFQKKGYVKGKSEKAFRCITPKGYGDLKMNLERYYRYKNNIPRNKEDLLWIAKGEILDNGKKAKNNIYYKIPKRDDAFLLYLGMPQRNNSFGISDYQPTQSKDSTKIYFKPNYWTNNMKQKLINDFFGDNYFNFGEDFRKYQKTSEYSKLFWKIRKDNLQLGYHEIERIIFQKKIKKAIINERSSLFDAKIEELKTETSREDPKMAEWVMDNPLGDFTLSRGEDEKGKYFSIYDIWDLEPFKNGDGSSYGWGQRGEAVYAMIQKLSKNNFEVNENTEISSIFGAGMPFEIYDRIYYDPETKKLIP